MEKKYGFTKLALNEFNSWLKNQSISRTVTYIQEHHTYRPDYDSFNGSNHFQLQKSMKNYHVNENGWRDIGQHFTIFPDGTIVTGRSLEYSPACIKGINSKSVCIENLGNFDTNGDTMTEEQKKAILEVTASLSVKFNVTVNTDKIIYHHWFNLDTGERNNGTKNNKSCPGTNFFGGNKVTNAQNNFIPLIKPIVASLSPEKKNVKISRYVSVTASRLNVREGAGIQFKKAAGKSPVEFGTILRIFNETNGWYKISNSSEYWVSGKYTTDVVRAEVNASVLNIRKGPGTNFAKVGKLVSGQEVFIYAEDSNWCRINDDEWVSKNYLNIS